MSANRWLSLGVAVGLLIRLRGLPWDALLGLVLGLVLLLSMIWFGDFWARHILPYGRGAWLARDYGDAERQGPVVALLGWIGLVVLFFLGGSQETAGF